MVHFGPKYVCICVIWLVLMLYRGVFDVLGLVSMKNETKRKMLVLGVYVLMVRIYTIEGD